MARGSGCRGAGVVLRRPDMAWRKVARGCRGPGLAAPGVCADNTTMAVSLGLAHVLRAVFKLPGLVLRFLKVAFRSLGWVLASGTVSDGRWSRLSLPAASA